MLLKNVIGGIDSMTLYQHFLLYFCNLPLEEAILKHKLQ